MKEILYACVIIGVIANLMTPRLAAYESQVQEPTFVSNMESANLAAIEARKADDELNRVYNKVIAYIRHAGNHRWEEAMITAQRNWIKYRDSDCGVVEFEWAGGTGQGGAFQNCLERTTLHRIEELKTRYEDIK